MAVSTANTILKSSTTKTGPYTKLVNIVNYPDMGGAPSTIDTTDLSATTTKTNITGLQELSSYTFECNYTKAEFDTLYAMIGDLQWFHLEFGDSGDDGGFEWSGKVNVFASGGGVDESRKMTLTISAESEPTPLP